MDEKTYQKIGEDVARLNTLVESLTTENEALIALRYEQTEMVCKMIDICHGMMVERDELRKKEALG